MEQITFKVQGSQPEPYTVVFKRNGLNLACLCNCQAGVNGLYCKHRLNLLKGDFKGVVSGTREAATMVQSWLPGTKIEKALEGVNAAADQVELAKAVFEKARSNLAKSMFG